MPPEFCGVAIREMDDAGCGIGGKCIDAAEREHMGKHSK